MSAWIARRYDDHSTAEFFETEREARAWINERTMPWEFYAIDAELPDNVNQAIEWSQRLGDLQLVRATLIGIFRRRELEGGHKAAFDHPLMKRIEAEKSVLEEQIMLLV